MNKEVENKVAALEKTVAAECEVARKSLLFSVIGYGLLFVFVLAYTTIVFNMIKERSTPDVIAALVGDYAKSKIPLLKDDLKRETKANAPAIAEKLMISLHSFIPQAEAFVKNQIDIAIETHIRMLKDKCVPEITSQIEVKLDNLEKVAKHLDDPDFPKIFALFFSDSLDEALAKICSDDAKRQIASLRDDLMTLKVKPEERLTAKECAERQLIVHWLFLVNNAEVGDRPFSRSLRFATEFAKHVDSFFVDDTPASIKKGKSL